MPEIRMGKQGRVVIPARLREQMGLNPGDRLSGRVEDGRLVLERRAEVLGRLQRGFAAAAGDRSPVDELIAERRAEAERESRS